MADDSGAAAGLLGSVGGGLIGTAMSSADKLRAKNAQQDALAQILGVQGPAFSQSQPSTPDLQTAIGAPQLQTLSPIALQQYQSAGTLSPIDEQLSQQGPSALSNIATDPALKDAQMQALASLQGIAASGGANLTDQANLNNILMQQRQNTSGQTAAIMDQQQRMGMGNSGSALLSQLNSAQNAANTASQNSLSIAGSDQQRALQALAQGGGMAGSMQQAQFGQQAQQAQAQDAISRFNAQNQQGVFGQNAQVANQAQLENLQAAQGLRNANTDMANRQTVQNQIGNTQYNNQVANQGFGNQAQAAQFGNQAAQQNYQNQNNQYQYGNQLAGQTANFNMGKARAAAGQDTNLSNYYGGQQKATMQMYTGLGKAAGQAGAAYAAAPSSAPTAPNEEVTA